MKSFITSMIAIYVATTSAEPLPVNGKQCIAGAASKDASFPQGDPVSGPGDAIHVHSHTSFVLDKDGNQIAEADQHFNSWVSMTSSLPNTVDIWCDQNTAKTLTECTALILNYGDQHWTSGDNEDRCACYKSSGPFTAEGYCACYFDC